MLRRSCRSQSRSPACGDIVRNISRRRHEYLKDIWRDDVFIRIYRVPGCSALNCRLALLCRPTLRTERYEVGDAGQHEPSLSTGMETCSLCESTARRRHSTATRRCRCSGISETYSGSRERNSVAGVAACGACTIHLDGDAVRSCVTSVSDASGKSITTIEGLDPEGNHPLQKAWRALNVPQCGYCQAGQIMQAAALLKQTPASHGRRHRRHDVRQHLPLRDLSAHSRRHQASCGSVT